MKPNWLATIAILTLAVGGVILGPSLIRNAVRGDIFGNMEALAQRQAAEARSALPKAKTDAARVEPLSTLVKFDVSHDKIAEAREYANELLTIAPKIKPKDYDKPDNIYVHDMGGNQFHSDYGIALYDGNTVMGRIAVREHRIDDAKKYLLAAGMTPGACTLNTFGPGMTLAQDLIGAGQRATVLQFFNECRRFWPSRHLNEWAEDVKDGGSPDFGANLYY